MAEEVNKQEENEETQAAAEAKAETTEQAPGDAEREPLVVDDLHGDGPDGRQLRGPGRRPDGQRGGDGERVRHHRRANSFALAKRESVEHAGNRRQRQQRQRPPGRLLAHPAGGEEPLPFTRAHDPAQDSRGLPRPVDRGAAEQGNNPEALSRPLLPGRRQLWRRGGLAILFRQVGARCDAGRSGHPRRWRDRNEARVGEWGIRASAAYARDAEL